MFSTVVKSRLDGKSHKGFDKFHNNLLNQLKKAITGMLINALSKTDSSLIFLYFQKRVVIFKSLSFLNALSHMNRIGPKW